MAALLWFIGAVALAPAEALVGDFFLLMLAGGALGAAGFSALTDLPVWADALVFAGLSVGLVVGVRPMLLRRYRSGPVVPTGVEALTGAHGTVIEPVSGQAGLIRLEGQLWTARTVDPDLHIDTGTTVSVIRIDGATAVVIEGV